MLVIGLGHIAPCLAAEESPPVPAPAPKSVRGTLDGVESGPGAVNMTTEDGRRVAWRFSPAVVAEVAKLPAGSPMIVIYRQIGLNEKRVTAVAFPGTAKAPTYVNLTGARVVLRSAAMVGDSCGAVTGPVTESVVPAGARGEIQQGCWCCAPFEGTCTPGNKSGLGTAYLERCFE
jgi:hypothetical protein